MVKSRSSYAFHQYPNIDPLSCKIDRVPHSTYNVVDSTGSPSRLDPFGSQVILSGSIHSRPSSTVGSPITPPVAGSATPHIVVASPSTSTIHYLFPSSETRSTNPLVSDVSTPCIQEETTKLPTRSHSTAGRQHQHPSLKHFRASFDRFETDRAAEQRVVDQAFVVPPSRSTTVSSVSRGSALGLFSPPQRSTEQRSTELWQSGSMRNLRRQPSRLDLGGQNSVHGLNVGYGPAKIPTLRRKESLALQEDEYSLDQGGWEFSGRPGCDLNPTGSLSPRSTVASHGPTYGNIQHQRPHMPERAAVALRRRSQSLSAPRPAPLPPVPTPTSPVLPAPDFGNPLSFADVLSSPSLSNLDYSTAGSTLSRKMSGGSSYFSRKDSSTYPTSVGMTRGDTRKGLGSYEAGKMKAHEDAVKRLNVEVRGLDTIRRSFSLKRRDSETRRPRPKSQSLSVKSVRDMDISLPVPVPERPLQRPPVEPGRGIRLGDPSIDFGGRYGLSCMPQTEKPSPSSGQSSLYPDSKSSFAVSTLPSLKDDGVIRIFGRPLHPALSSEISNMAPSTVGLGFSPMRTPGSLPESLEAQILDLVEDGRKLASLSIQDNNSPDGRNLPKRSDSLPKLPQFSDRLARPMPLYKVSEAEETRQRVRRSLLLSQNTFFLPPVHQKSALRASKSLGPASVRPAFASASPNAQSSMTSLVQPPPLQKQLPPRMGLSASVNPSLRQRSVKAFSVCSPADAIEPLPLSPWSPSLNPEAFSEPRLRSKKSSPFLSASASLRIIFGRDGFVARSLSQAFEQREKEHHLAGSILNGRTVNASLKSRISSPLEAGCVSRDTQNVRYDNRAWRESVRQQAVSLNISTQLNRLADEEEPARMVSSGSKSRLAIPPQLLSAAVVLERNRPESEYSEVLYGIGSTMLRYEHSIDIGLNLRNDVARFVTDDDAPPLPKAIRPNLRKEERTLKEIGKEESNISASVYSNNAPTAKDSPRAGLVCSSQPAQPIPMSRWSPSPVKKPKKMRSRPLIKAMISPPMPARSTPRSTCIPSQKENTVHAIATFPLTKAFSSSKSRVFSLSRSTVAPPPPTSEFTPPVQSHFSLSLRSKTKFPRRGKTINSGLTPISSRDMPPPRTLLDELSAREDERVDVDATLKKEEKVKKVLNWRRDVGQNDELTKLEDKMLQHVEREREALKGIAEAKSPKKGMGGRTEE